MRYEDKLERVESLIKELRESSKQGAIILVEGRKDKRALRELGVEGEVIFASHFPLLKLIDHVANNGAEIVVLTDWDRKGDLLAERINRYLIALGHTPNLRIRVELSRLIKKDAREVENLPSYIARLRVECGFNESFDESFDERMRTINY
jgi:5S rRNA maturation endonuclease (ribonuclease M5)